MSAHAPALSPITGKPRNPGVLVRSFTNVNSVANPSGLAIHSGGTGIVAAAAGSLGTGDINLPATINKSLPFLVQVPVTITDPNDGRYTLVSLTALASTANAAFYGGDVQFDGSSGKVTFHGGGASSFFQIMPMVAGTYTVCFAGDGSNVTISVLPPTRYGSAGNYDSNSLTALATQGDVYRGYPIAAQSSGTVVTIWDNIARVQVQTTSAVNHVDGVFANIGGLTGSSELPLPAYCLLSVGSEAGTIHLRLPSGYDGRSALDLVVIEHANNSDERQGQRLVDSDTGTAFAYLVQRGFAILSYRGGDGTTYNSATSSNWGSAAGLVLRKAIIERALALLPNVRNLYGVGQSMGLLNVLNHVRQHPGLFKAVAGISGVTNLSYAYASEAFKTVIDTASGFSTLAAYQDHDPNLQPKTYANVPLALWHGTSDTTVHKANHADLFKTNVEAQGGSVTVTSVIGAGHVDTAALWDGPALATFFGTH